MIKVDPTVRTVRETTAPFQFTDKGELKTEPIRVLYYSLKIQEIKKRRAELEAKAKDAPDSIIWLSETLVDRIAELPDLTDAKGKPLAITVENLDAIDLSNLEAIKKAIDGAERGEAQPDK